jgi:hypothetical protein
VKELANEMHNIASILGSRAQKDASIEDCQCSRKIGDWASQCWLLQRKEKTVGAPNELIT